jgi:recombination protein RecA
MLPGLLKARDLAEHTTGERHSHRDTWTLRELQGRITELSGAAASAGLTLAASLIREAHAAHQPVAWVAGVDSVFFPPDFAAAGVDLRALPVVWARTQERAAMAAETLLRSSAFALVVLDLGRTTYLDEGILGRLLRLAQQHQSAVLCITRKSRRLPSLGSMVSRRVEAVRSRLAPAYFRCDLKLLKDKQHEAAYGYREEYHGPAGVR